MGSRVLVGLCFCLILSALHCAVSTVSNVHVDVAGNVDVEDSGREWGRIMMTVRGLNNLDPVNAAFLSSLGQITLVGCSGLKLREQTKTSTVQLRVLNDRRHSFLTLWLDRLQRAPNDPVPRNGSPTKIVSFLFSPEPGGRALEQPIEMQSAAFDFPADTKTLSDLIHGDIRKVHSTKNPHGADPSFWRLTPPRIRNMEEVHAFGFLNHGKGRVGLYTKVEEQAGEKPHVKDLAAVDSVWCSSAAQSNSQRQGAVDALVCRTPMWISADQFNSPASVKAANLQWSRVSADDKVVKVRSMISVYDVNDAAKEHLRAQKAGKPESGMNAKANVDPKPKPKPKPKPQVAEDHAHNPQTDISNEDAEKMERIRQARQKLQKDKQTQANKNKEKIRQQQQRQRQHQQRKEAARRQAQEKDTVAKCKEESWCRSAPSTKRMPDGTENPKYVTWCTMSPFS